MNLACQITVSRILLVPVFGVLALRYGWSTAAGAPEAWLRWSALAVFVIAAASDGVDGWVARRFNQKTALGAFLDPIADKLLLACGALILTCVDWGREGWHLPAWYAAIVLLRDALILIAIRLLWNHRCKIEYGALWSGKLATVTQMIALGWIMLGWIDFSPAWPCGLAAACTLWSAWDYLKLGLRIYRQGGTAQGA